jgi:hypothetical protein
MDVHQIAQGLESLGKEIRDGVYSDYYEAKTEAESLEEYKKTMLAVAELEVWSRHPDATQSEIARRALASDSYKEYLSGLKEAQRRMNQALAKVKSAEARISIYQSINKHLQYAEFNQ